MNGVWSHLCDDLHRRGAAVDDEQPTAAGGSRTRTGSEESVMGQMGALSGRSAADWHGRPLGVTQLARS